MTFFAGVFFGHFLCVASLSFVIWIRIGTEDFIQLIKDFSGWVENDD